MKAFRYRAGRLRKYSARDAAAWWALQGDDARLAPEVQAARRAWLAGDSDRREAYDRARAALDALTANAGEPELMALRQKALAARREPAKLPWMGAAAGLAVSVVLCGVVSFAWITHPGFTKGGGGHEIYRTAIGERSTFNLPDGSVATLDTDSVLQVDYTEYARAVHLRKGQALFDVAKHKPIPFQVYAGDRRITAVGTVFDVRVEQGRVRVALIEGRIQVAQLAPRQGPGQHPGTEIALVSGEVLDTSAGEPMLVKRAELARLDSWKDGIVVFNDARLADALAELNRYTDRPIRLGDASIRELRVTGVFKTGEPERFAQTMAEIFPLTVTVDSAGSPVLRRRSL